jgi:hypothetical protein
LRRPKHSIIEVVEPGGGGEEEVAYTTRWFKYDRD